MLIAVLSALTAISSPRLAAQTGILCSKTAALRGEAAQVAACREVLARDSSNATAWENLAISLSQTGDYQNAAAAWESFTRLRPTEYTGYYNLGLMREMIRQP
jgi:Flp pilus assembly protein TadD